MKIEKLEVIEVALPPRRAHGWATSRTPIGQGYAIVKVITDEGLVGLGEATTMIEWGGDYHRYSGESGATVKHVLDAYIGPVVTGMDPFDVHKIRWAMGDRVRGHLYAKAAIDMALYDIMGKALDVPVYRLLGGKSRDGVAIAQSLGLLEGDEAVDEAVAVVEEGIGTVKVKGGLDPKRDIRIMTQLRKALGDEIDLVIDANQSYASVAEALYVSRGLGSLGVRYLEQPVPGWTGLAEIRERGPVPIMADESVWTPEDALEGASRRATDYISIYTTKPGGLTAGMEVAAIAKAAGIPCNVNGSAETGVGNAANLHLAIAAPAVTEACVVPITTIAGQEQTEAAGLFYLDDIITEPFPYKDGKLFVPDKPGLGIELDEDKMNKYRLAR